MTRSSPRDAPRSGSPLCWATTTTCWWSQLDVTSIEDVKDAARAAVDRFGRIDVLVNNAGSFYAGFFEEISPEDFRAQIETTLFGPVNLTRAVLPVMRAQRSGLVVTISSTAGIEGGEFLSAYAASKFGVEGWMESLAPEVAPFGIRTMLVEPGFFRTELLTPESTQYAHSSIEDYAERTEQTVTAWKGMNGQQGGDPAKLAEALIQLVHRDEQPLRFPAGADAVDTFERRAKALLPRPTPTGTCPATSPTTTPEGSEAQLHRWAPEVTTVTRRRSRSHGAVAAGRLPGDRGRWSAWARVGGWCTRPREARQRHTSKHHQHPPSG